MRSCAAVDMAFFASASPIYISTSASLPSSSSSSSMAAVTVTAAATPTAALCINPRCISASSNSSSSSTSSPASLSSDGILRLFRAKPWPRPRRLAFRAAAEPRTRAFRTAATEENEEGESSARLLVSRRRACLDLAAASSAALVAMMAKADNARAREVEVGSYLPVSPDDSRFVQYRASAKDTPALRAGNVQPYGFNLPPTWKQERVANILSGNYCQPKCAEPWVEVKFADSKQGSIQVVAAPMVRLTNKPNATIEEIGSPDKILAALGPFVTGNTYDPDEVMGTSVQHRGDQTYYSYELETPFARTGAHNLASATAKGSVVMLFVVSASDAQWSSSEKLLRSIVESFGV